MTTKFIWSHIIVLPNPNPNPNPNPRSVNLLIIFFSPWQRDTPAMSRTRMIF